MPVGSHVSGAPRLLLVLVALVGQGAACDLTSGRPVVGGIALTGVAGTGSAAGASGGAGGGAPAGCGDAASACEPSQPIITCGVTNARDLGGIPLGAADVVTCGQVFRGPPLAGLSGRACGEAARLGIRTIIDLRTPSERSALPDDPCVGANIVLAPLPIPYQVSAANYIADFDTKESIARVFRTLGDPAAYPVYFHCTYGRDRTGVVAAAIFLALGASRADIVKEYSLSAATVGAFPASLEALLDEIARRGGIEPALRAAGVTDADLATLTARLRARSAPAPSAAQ